jgi:hypothetical protein
MNFHTLKYVHFFLVLSWISMFVTDGFAQCYINHDWKWPNTSVTYHINSDIGTSIPGGFWSDYTTAIEAAASQWSKAGSPFKLSRGWDVNYALGTEPTGIYQVGYYYSNDVIHAKTLINHPNGVITEVQTYCLGSAENGISG